MEQDCKIQTYLKSINPIEKDELPPLFFGAKYMCFKKDKFIGVATWQKDENVGNSFQQNGKTSRGQDCINILIPDEWDLIPDKFQNKNYEKKNN